jgi:glycerophosphoryl diester phosphodiesterase
MPTVRTLAALAVFLVLGALTTVRASVPVEGRVQPDTLAHRGGAAMAPENTRAAFAYGRGIGAAAIETDVQLSSDGVPVLVHDRTLVRTTNAATVFPDRTSYEVGEFTWAELQQLDAGGWYHRDFAGERIPRLEDLVDYADQGAGLDIELKNPSLSPGLEQVVSYVLAADRRWDELARRGGLMVTSFDLESLATFHALRPDLPVAGVGRVPADDDALRGHAGWMSSWVTNYRFLQDGDVPRLQSAGLDVIVYTVNKADDMERMLDLGVDGVLTDVPRVLQLVKERRLAAAGQARGLQPT